MSKLQIYFMRFKLHIYLIIFKKMQVLLSVLWEIIELLQSVLALLHKARS